MILKIKFKKVGAGMLIWFFFNDKMAKLCKAYFSPMGYIIWT
jgi:hypothetical protein